jgi:hypothetical protein
MCFYLQRLETSLNPFRYSVVNFFYIIKYPIKKPLPEDFASGGGPTIHCIYLQRQEASLNPFTYSVVNFFYVIKYPIKKPHPEDSAPGGGPTIHCIYLQRQEASLNPFTYSVVNLTNHIAFYTALHPPSQDFFEKSASEYKRTALTITISSIVYQGKVAETIFQEAIRNISCFYLVLLLVTSYFPFANFYSTSCVFLAHLARPAILAFPPIAHCLLSSR